MPDIGVSKDSLRQLIGLTGEFVGTTDVQVLEGKTYNTTDNTLTATSQAAGDILKNNGTKFVRLARGAAGQPLTVNSGATDVEYGTLTVAGGGTGATTLTGILKGAGTANITAVAAPTGAILGDSDVQNITGRKTFMNETFGLRNPLNTGTLTFTTPNITGDQEHRVNSPYSYFIFNDGTTVWAMNGKTGAIEIEGATADSTRLVFQYTVDQLVTTGGRIKIAEGTYNINAPGIVIPQHNGYSITIEGDGWRNTKIQWTGALDTTNYLFDSYSTDAFGWQNVDFRDLQLWGGPSTTDRRVKVLRMGRTNTNSAAHYRLQNVRVANGISPQITGDYLQDTYWYFAYAESNGGTPTPIVDVEIKNSSHVNLYGCTFGSVTVDQSRVNMYGGTLQNLDIQAVTNYVCTFDGVFMDPMIAGHTHQIKVGTTGPVIGVIFNNIGFSSETTVPATDRYFYIHNAKNVHIRNSRFMPGNTLTYMVEFTSTATNNFLWLQSQDDITKILNSSTSTQIYNPFINNLVKINNPSGTLGALLQDTYTGNQVNLASSALHLYNQIKSTSASAKWGVLSRNAANSADVVRLRIGNIQNQGFAPIEYIENFQPSGGVSLIPFQKAGTPVDGDFLNPVNGLVCLDTTNSIWYARIGAAWVAVGGHVIPITKGGTGQVTATAAYNALSPTTTLGDIDYNNGTDDVRLAGNTTLVKQYLSQTGNGTISAAPAWVTPTSVIYFPFFVSNNAATTVFYMHPSSNGWIASGAEATADMIFDYAMTVTRVRFVVTLNTRTQNTIISFRDDAADVTGTAVTVAATVTGEQDSGAISAAVAAGSKLAFKYDPATAGGTGNMTCAGWVEALVALQ